MVSKSSLEEAKILSRYRSEEECGWGGNSPQSLQVSGALLNSHIMILHILSKIAPGEVKKRPIEMAQSLKCTY